MFREKMCQTLGDSITDDLRIANETNFNLTCEAFTFNITNETIRLHFIKLIIIWKLTGHVLHDLSPQNIDFQYLTYFSLQESLYWPNFNFAIINGSLTRM